MQEWIPIVQGVGVPTAILLMMAYALWLIVPWLGKRVQEVVVRHLQFIDEVEKSVKKEAENVHSIMSLQASFTREMTEMAQWFSKLTEANKALTDKQAELTAAHVKTAKRMNGENV